MRNTVIQLQRIRVGALVESLQTVCYMRSGWLFLCSIYPGLSHCCFGSSTTPSFSHPLYLCPPTLPNFYTTAKVIFKIRSDHSSPAFSPAMAFHCLERKARLLTMASCVPSTAASFLFQERENSSRFRMLDLLCLECQLLSWMILPSFRPAHTNCPPT